MVGLRLRWALRDAKARWVQVAATALMLALGTGLFAGLSSVTQWRFASNDASLSLTNMYDLRGQLSDASFLPGGALADIAAGIPGVDSVEERLIVPTQVDVAAADESIFVPGRILGVDLSDGGPHVNGVETLIGRPIEESEWGAPVVLLERNFGMFYNLPASGDLKIGGEAAARYVGQAASPEYFLVIEEGNYFAQTNLAVVFTSLETAQKLAGRPGLVNDLVLTVEPGADLDVVEAALVSRMAESYPETGLSVMRREDDASYLSLTRDPEGDQQFYTIFALAIFAGAAFAALNLATRMVEVQRREIGTSMALGVSPRAIAVRPLLVGVQIAVLGVVFGVGIGLLVGNAMGSVLETFVPLPAFVTPFQIGIFAGAAALGFAIPLLAVLWPVYRAVRVAPVDAIRTGHLAARGGGMAPIASRLPLPGGVFGRMPFRNLTRAPRRTLLTLFALTAVLAVLVSLIGTIDSFLATITEGDEELLGDVPDRLTVQLDSFYPSGSAELAGIVDSEVLRAAEPELRLAGSVEKDGTAIDVQLRFVDFASGVWRPTAVDGELAVGSPGIVLARKAAEDLGVGPGDQVALTHPVRTSAASLALETSTIEVLAVHPHPLRFNAYMDIRQAGMVGLEGLANVISGAPAPGATVSSVKRALFGVPAVATVQGVAETSEMTSEVFEQFADVFRVIQVFVLGLALLIAFNTANINADERARDHATMFAFGVPVRRVLGVLMMEGLVLGLIAAAFSVVLGYGLLLWILWVVFPMSAPDLGVAVAVDLPAMAATLLAAVVVIALAPVLTLRKLRRMDVPATLRVLE